jgi:hypothetical protein
MDSRILEDILVYSLIVGILIFAYYKYVHVNKTTEGFIVDSNKIREVQTRIQGEISTVRASSPNFFTQTSTPPILPKNKSFLVNICPLTGYLGGYLGPPEKLMDANFYLQTAFKAGIRSFVIPISTYINISKVPPDWPYSGEPALVCRDSTGIIISENGITLDEFVSFLIQNKSVSGFGSEPIFLFLEDTISDVDRKRINYVSFMKKIAKSLSPLDPYRLINIGSYGSVVGGLQQQKLLTEIPLSTFTDKIIISTNFDTSQDNSLALASYANFIYSTDNTLPVRTVLLEDLPGSNIDYVTDTRINWYIVKSRDPLTAPTAENVQLAFNNGMQCIPIPLLSTPMSTIKHLWSMWKGASYILKPEKTLYTQPTPIVPSQLSTKLNASIRGHEPGNLVID